jgi:hypothetical protein
MEKEGSSLDRGLTVLSRRERERVSLRERAWENRLKMARRPCRHVGLSSLSRAE